MTKDEIILANKEFLFPAVFHYYREPLVVARAKDQYVWDADGNQYLDFLGGIVTVSVGHCNDAGQRQGPPATRYPAARLHGVRQRAAGGAGDRRSPRSRPTASSPRASSPTAARRPTRPPSWPRAATPAATEIVALRHSYHGRSAMAMTLTGQGHLAARTRRRPASSTRTTPTATAAPSASRIPTATCAARATSRN